MKVIVLENFHVYEATLEGQPERRVNYGKGMVLPDVPDDVAQSWAEKGHVRIVDTPQQSSPISEDLAGHQ